MKLTLGDIADRFDLTVQGDRSVSVTGIAKPDEAGPSELTFLFNSSYRKKLAACMAAAVVISESDAKDCPLPCLLSKQPRLSWAQIATLFDDRPIADGRHQATAIVDESAEVGENVTVAANVVIEAGAKIGSSCWIGPGCVIGAGTILGKDCRLYANVSLYHSVVLGNGVIVHSGAVIGADGFGFEPSAGGLVKIPQIYGVVIGNDVEIGAGTTIDRGALNATEIGNGTKLDNQVQVGHGTRIGEGTAISGCTAIAGSTTIGNYCLIGGAVGIIDNLTITDRVEVTAKSLVSQSITESGRYSSGTGLMSGNEWKRNIVGFKQLAELVRRVRKLERAAKRTANGSH